MHQLKKINKEKNSSLEVFDLPAFIFDMLIVFKIKTDLLNAILILKILFAALNSSSCKRNNSLRSALVNTQLSKPFRDVRKILAF